MKGVVAQIVHLSDFNQTLTLEQLEIWWTRKISFDSPSSPNFCWLSLVLPSTGHSLYPDADLN